MNLYDPIQPVRSAVQRFIPLVLLTFAWNTLAGCQSAPPQSVVSFRHLDHLTEHAVVGEDSVAIVHVYANYPAYE